MTNARKIVGEMARANKGKKVGMGNVMEIENQVFDRIIVDPAYELDGKRRALNRARKRAAAKNRGQ